MSSQAVQLPAHQNKIFDNAVDRIVFDQKKLASVYLLPLYSFGLLYYFAFAANWFRTLHHWRVAWNRFLHKSTQKLYTLCHTSTSVQLPMPIPICVRAVTYLESRQWAVQAHDLSHLRL